MGQTFISPKNIKGNSFIIEGSEAHHILKVLRKKTEDPLEFFDGQGTRYLGKLVFIDRESGTAEGIILKKHVFPQKSAKICVFQGLPKGSKFDYCLEKMVELGADLIVPFLSRKNLIELNARQAQQKMTRWNKLIQSAAKQSLRSHLPQLDSVKLFQQLKPQLNQGTTWVFSPEENSLSLKSVIQSHPHLSQNLNIVIGPESGFSKEELTLLSDWGGVLVNLGTRVLRTETAALTILSILNHEYNLF